MSDVLDLIDRLARMSHDAAEKLRAEVATAQAVLDRLDAFTKGAEDTMQLAAASDLFPNWSALIPDGAGLISGPNRRPDILRVQTHGEDAPQKAVAPDDDDTLPYCGRGPCSNIAGHRGQCSM
jgi:hypothetical protein